MASNEKIRKLVERRAALIVAQRTRPLTDAEKRWLDKQWSKEVEEAFQREDRRSGARVQTDLACNLSTDDGPCGGRVQNLSLVGALILAPAGFAELGETVSIEIDIAEGTVPVSVLGDVVRVEERGAGAETRYAVRFTLVEPKQRSDLSRFIESLTDAPK